MSRLARAVAYARADDTMGDILLDLASRRSPAEAVHGLSDTLADVCVPSDWLYANHMLAARHSNADVRGCRISRRLRDDG